MNDDIATQAREHAGIEERPAIIKRITLPNVPIGYNFGPSHIPGCDHLILYLGSSSHGFVIHREQAAAIEQELIALGVARQLQAASR